MSGIGVESRHNSYLLRLTESIAATSCTTGSAGIKKAKDGIQMREAGDADGMETQAPIIIRDFRPKTWRINIETPSDSARVANQIARMDGAWSQAGATL